MCKRKPRLPRFLPFPTGNINGLFLPSCMAALRKVDYQWWFYVGLLTDKSKEKHSFELSFITIENHKIPPLFRKKLAIVDFDFTFEIKKGEKSFHASSISNPESKKISLKALHNFLGWLNVSADNKSFNMRITPLLLCDRHGPKARLSYNPAESSPTLSMYSGYFGQPGACYDFHATGKTFLMYYASDKPSTPVVYVYKVALKLVDERGIVPEGWGGYVGINQCQSKSDPKRNLSVEYAQPRLRIKSWSIKLSPYKTHSGDTYEFSNDDGFDFLWLDRQALHPEPSAFKSASLEAASSPITHISKRMGLTRGIGEAIQKFKRIDRAKIRVQTLNRIKKNIQARQPEAAKQLYCGCWLALTLTQGLYKDISAVFVAFWREARIIGDYDTDKKNDAIGGFMNLYLGLLKRGDYYDPVSAYTLTDVLEMNDHAPLISHPYRIHFTEQFSKIGNLPDPERWAKTIEITVKGSTQARHALAAYAKRVESKEPQTVDQDVVFTLNTVSRYTVTTLQGSSFYEGAAEVKDGEGNLIGSAWVEQMVGEPEK